MGKTSVRRAVWCNNEKYMRGALKADFRNRARSLVLCLLFVGVSSSVMPLVAEADDFDFLMPATYVPTFRAEHAGTSIYNGNPVNILLPPEVAAIRSSELGGVNGSWIIEELTAWGHDVPSERGVYVLERIDPATGSLEGGTAILGQNYAVAHVAWSGTATTTHTFSFSMPNMGADGTLSGRYKLLAAELSAGKTDEDVGEFLEKGAGFASVLAPASFSISPAIFDYVNDGPPVVAAPVDGPPPCTENCFSNVLFLPGIESSRLYMPQVVGSNEQRLWEPGNDDDLENLYLTPEEVSVRPNVYTKVGDVVDELPVAGKNIYKSFILKMDDLKTQNKITDWEAVPYDWRLSLDDILSYGNNVNGHIYYSGTLRATSTPYIIQELRHLAETSKSGKVTIIAHSNGGLVAKQLTELLGPEAPELIDKMIFVAVPQAGTPMAIAAGLHGYNQQHLGGLINTEEDARTFSSTTPMIYNLLPSAQYFTRVDDPVVKFDFRLSDWIDLYGNFIHSEERLRDFLTSALHTTDAKTGDIDQPIKMNYAMLRNAEELHADLDAWTPPVGVDLIQIAGWGVPKTVKGITYKEKKGGGVKPEWDFTVDGDGTVVVPSALWTSTTASTTNYWVDLQKYNKRSENQISFGFLNINHANILEVPKLLNFISDQISSTINPLSDYTYISTQAPPESDLRLRYALHSPLTLDLYDNLGNHTGVATSTGEVEENIPGTYFVQFGDVKYIFADNGTPQHVVMSGYDTGTFTFEAGELQGDTVIASTVFRDVPTTPQTQVRFDVLSGFGSASDLSIDENGDGTVDSSYASSTGEIIVLDSPPIEIVESIPVSPSTGGGGGIPSLLPQGTPAAAVVATTTSAIATTTSVVANASQQETASSTSPIIVEKQPKKIAQVSVNVPAKKKPVVATDIGKDSKLDSQVASVAQVTDDGLWLRARRWIMNTIRSLLKL